MYYPLVLGEYNKFQRFYESFRLADGGHVADKVNSYSLGTVGLPVSSKEDLGEGYFSRFSNYLAGNRSALRRLN